MTKAAAVDDFSPADVQAGADQRKADAIAFRDTNKVEVRDLSTLAQARRIRLEIVKRKAEIKTELAKPKGWANSLHKWFCALENAAFAPYDELDRFESAQIVAFDEAQEASRLERERQLSASRRIGLEAQATHEAAALEAAGEHALARSVISEAIAAPDPVVVLVDEVASIQSFRKTWHWRVSNKDLIPREFLAPDEEKLDKYADAMNDDARVPGIEFYYTKTPIRR